MDVTYTKVAQYALTAEFILNNALIKFAPTNWFDEWLILSWYSLLIYTENEERKKKPHTLEVFNLSDLATFSETHLERWKKLKEERS